MTSSKPVPPLSLTDQITDLMADPQPVTIYTLRENLHDIETRLGLVQEIRLSPVSHLTLLESFGSVDSIGPSFPNPLITTTTVFGYKVVVDPKLPPGEIVFIHK